MSKPRWSPWRLKTLLEILPVIIALTALGSYSTITKSSQVALVTPLGQVLHGVSGWVVALMGLVGCVGLCGMGWLLYIFSRPQEVPDGRDRD